MTKKNDKAHIRILKKGPYLVSGNVPISEKIIVPKGKGYVYEDGRVLPQAEEYALCRCGRSKNPPFCDGKHTTNGPMNDELANKSSKFEDRARLVEGPGLDMWDDHRCGTARLCHRELGLVWDLVKESDDEEKKQEAIRGALECPTGRLVPVEKNGEIIETEYEPAIEVLQDPEKSASCGLYVKGSIPIESTDGRTYEPRNRTMLCRCGNSRNMPFCDGTHLVKRFNDGYDKRE